MNFLQGEIESIYMVTIIEECGGRGTVMECTAEMRGTVAYF